MQSLKNTMIVWNRRGAYIEPGSLRLEPWPDKRTGKHYDSNLGACYFAVQSWPFWKRAAHACVIAFELEAFGFDPKEVHKVMSQLKEYAAAYSTLHEMSHG